MKMLGLMLIMLAIVGCGGGAHMVLPESTQQHTDQTKVGKGAAESSLTFYSAIVPLVEKKCSTCHGQGSAIGNWFDFNQVILKKERILNRVVQKKDMPMGLSMTEAERKIFEKWIQEGAVEGVPVADEISPAEPLPPVEVEPPSDSPSQPPPSEKVPQVPPVENVPEQPPQSPNAPLQPESIVFVKHIKPLFERACSICHNAGSGDFMPNWLEYSISYGKRMSILDRVVVKKDMPMGVEFTEGDRELVKRWIDQGAMFDVQPSEAGER